jgi:hypothetical protein
MNSFNSEGLLFRICSALEIENSVLEVIDNTPSSLQKISSKKMVEKIE